MGGGFSRVRWSPVVLVVGGVCQLFGFPACRFVGFPTCWEVGELAGWQRAGVMNRNDKAGCARGGRRRAGGLGGVRGASPLLQGAVGAWGGVRYVARLGFQWCWCWCWCWCLGAGPAGGVLQGGGERERPKQHGPARCGGGEIQGVSPTDG